MLYHGSVYCRSVCAVYVALLAVHFCRCCRSPSAAAVVHVRGIIHSQLLESLISHSRHSLVSLLSLESSGHCTLLIHPILHITRRPCTEPGLTERLLMSCKNWLYQLSVMSTPPRAGMRGPPNTLWLSLCQLDRGHSALITTLWCMPWFSKCLLIIRGIGVIVGNGYFVPSKEASSTVSAVFVWVRERVKCVCVMVVD